VGELPAAPPLCRGRLGASRTRPRPRVTRGARPRCRGGRCPRWPSRPR
jgi:hypothetical protein